MKLHYYPDTDSLYIELSGRPGVETREIAEGVVADMDEAGAVVGFDIDAASTKPELTTLETVSLPLKTTTRGLLAMAVDDAAPPASQ